MVSVPVLTSNPACAENFPSVGSILKRPLRAPLIPLIPPSNPATHSEPYPTASPVKVPVGSWMSVPTVLLEAAIGVSVAAVASRTHTNPGPTAMAVGFPPTPMVCVWWVLASIRVTVPPCWATQIAPSPAAMAVGTPGRATTAESLSVLGSMTPAAFPVTVSGPEGVAWGGVPPRVATRTAVVAIMAARTAARPGTSHFGRRALEGGAPGTMANSPLGTPRAERASAISSPAVG